MASQTALLQTKLPFYRCPSSPAPELNNRKTASYPGSAFTDLATSNYMGNQGLEYGFVNTVGSPFYTPVTSDSNGRFNAVTDGLSNTIFVGERTWDLPNVTASSSPCLHPNAGIWIGTRQSGYVDNFSQAQRAIGGSQLRLNNCIASSLHYSSSHVGGGHFLLGDGSVKFVSENIDSQQYTVGPGPGYALGPLNGIYERLFHRSDGNVVGDF